MTLCPSDSHDSFAAVWNEPLPFGNYTRDNVTHRHLKSVLTRPASPLLPVTWIAVHIRRGDFLTFFKLDTNSDVFITPDSFFSGDDLATLALCEHTIVTAGSYGWWAAWLAGGNVVHDLQYPVASQQCDRQDYFPPWFLFPHNYSSPSSFTSSTAPTQRDVPRMLNGG
jgi:hypothetical protein